MAQTSIKRRKILFASIVIAVVAAASFGYEFFVANSLSGYTKITLTPWSYPPCSVKFGNTSYYIVFFLIGESVYGMPAINTPPNPFFQVTSEETLIINQNESFAAIQGAKYSFGGLRIVVGSMNVTSNPNVNSDQLILYVKSTISSSEPIIFPAATPAISPTPYPSSPVPVATPPYIEVYNSQTPFTVAMPIEYVNYTVSSVNGVLLATVDGTFPMQIPQDWVGEKLPMLYPTPRGVTNISLALNGQSVGWSNDTQTHPGALHYTYLGYWSMITCTIQPPSVDFLLTIHYQHPISQVNGTYLFLYDLNISPYLSESSNSSIAYFTVRFNVDCSNIKVYTVPGDSSIPRDNTRTPVNFTTSNSNGVQTVAFNITSSFSKPVPGDELIVFDYPRTEFSWLLLSITAILLVVAAMIVLAIYKARVKSDLETTTETHARVGRNPRLFRRNGFFFERVKRCLTISKPAFQLWNRLFHQ